MGLWAVRPWAVAISKLLSSGLCVGCRTGTRPRAGAASRGKEETGGRGAVTEEMEASQKLLLK